MKVLLDTQVFLWWTSAGDRLTARALALIEDPEVDVTLSVASAWEIAIKSAAGRLELETAPEHFVPDRLRRHGFSVLPVQLSHALRAGSLPRHHGDPFDRMIVAQAQVEDIPVVTSDPLLGLYDVETIW